MPLSRRRHVPLSSLAAQSPHRLRLSAAAHRRSYETNALSQNSHRMGAIARRPCNCASAKFTVRTGNFTAPTKDERSSPEEERAHRLPRKSSQSAEKAASRAYIDDRQQQPPHRLIYASPPFGFPARRVNPFFSGINFFIAEVRKQIPFIRCRLHHLFSLSRLPQSPSATAPSEREPWNEVNSNNAKAGTSKGCTGFAACQKSQF